MTDGNACIQHIKCQNEVSSERNGKQTEYWPKPSIQPGRYTQKREAEAVEVLRAQGYAQDAYHPTVFTSGEITIDLSKDPATSFLAESAYLASKQKGPVDAVRYIRQAVFPNKAIYEQSPIPHHLSTLRPAHRIIQVTI